MITSACLRFRLAWIHSCWRILLTCKISNRSNLKLSWYYTFIFPLFFSCSTMTSYWCSFKWNEAWNQENGDVHVCDFESRYLKNQLAHEGQWWLILLDFSCSFIWAELVLTPEFPFNKFTVSDRTVLKLVTLALRICLKLSCEYELHTFSNTKVTVAKNHGENNMKVRLLLVRHLLRDSLFRVCTHVIHPHRMLGVGTETMENYQISYMLIVVL